MRPNTSQLVHHVDKIDESMRMSLDANSIAHLMQVLTDLYSDPVMAVIREYSTNARDSHIEAGVDRPIEVTLPTSLNPVFSVRDYGVGLSVDDLRDVYSMYGRSTKRESDDVTGTLGLGCKSGLTYALSFTVTAVKDGIKTVAAITKDTDGVGTIKVMDTLGTDEPNGVIVTIPVKAHDVNEFVTKSREFYRYWRRSTVLVDGQDPADLSWDEGGLGGKEMLWLDEDIAVVSSNGSGSKIVMGGVAYPFDARVTGVSVLAWVPMGSVNFTPAREALHFTSLTNQTIDAVKEFVGERLIPAIKTAIEEAATPYDQLRKAVKWWYHAQGALRDHWAKTEYLPLDDGSAWHVHFSSGYKARAERKDSLRLTDLVGDHHVITEFPYKTVGAAHKDRLQQFGCKNPILLPAGADTFFLEGKKESATWQEVFDSTDKPVLPGGGNRSKTEYEVRHKGGTYTTTQITETDAPIVYATPGCTVSYLLHKFPEARSVEIKSTQVNRFLRLHPEAQTVSTYMAKVVKRLKSKLTDEDKMWLKTDRNKLKPLAKMAARIEDPVLRSAVQSIGRSASPALQKLLDLNATADIVAPPSAVRLTEKYPLLYRSYGYNEGHGVLEDLIVYVNAKHNMEESK